MNYRADVVVLGGGIAGLTAARDLTAAGLTVVLLEARERLGGRIFTQQADKFPVELGAEFIHGSPPQLMNLSESAGITLAEITGQFRSRRNGQWLESGELMSKMEQLFAQLPPEGPDQSFLQFLQSVKASEELGRQACAFVEGFHAADPARVSVMWLRHTAEAEQAIGGETQFRTREGCNALVKALAGQISQAKCRILMNAPAKEVRWNSQKVIVKTRDSECEGARAVITLPLGVLKQGAVQFSPPLKQKVAALRKLEMGPALRVVLCFQEKFWETHDKLTNLSFLFTDDPQFPTWWTSNPLPYSILTGWAGGRYARALAGRRDSQLVELAVQALERILPEMRNAVRPQLRAGFVHDWQADAYSCGAYSYPTVGGLHAARALAAPVNDTLFFAGEATDYEGNNATIHGAMASGVRVAKEVLAAARAAKPAALLKQPQE
jgi:monoamine oxidase